jgi:hypothetical protein
VETDCSRYCPVHATGVKLPDDFVVNPLQYVEEPRIFQGWLAGNAGQRLDRPTSPGRLSRIALGIEPATGRRDPVVRIDVPLLPAGDSQRVAG